MKVWLDDCRFPNPLTGWDIWVKTAKEAINLLKSGKVEVISLDHDLGDEKITGTGYDVAKYIEEGAFHGTVPPLLWVIHSANPVGRMNMGLALSNADRYWMMNDEGTDRIEKK